MIARLASLVLLPFTLASASGAQGGHESAWKPLKFLSGRWVSQAGTEVQEETWSPASGDSMIGSFRVVEHGRPVFYEFWAVEIEDRQLVLKLKHFNANLVGWEEKTVSTRLPLIATDRNDAVFAEPNGAVSLHYHRLGPKLTCTVHHVADGKTSDETFILTRAQDPSQTGQNPS